MTAKFLRWVTLLLTVVCAAASADGPVISAGARLAGTCAACHGTNGATRGAGQEGLGNGAAVPSLAGQSRQALSASLLAYKAGTRPSTIMTQIAKAYTDEQIELLAAYFATQKNTAAP